MPKYRVLRDIGYFKGEVFESLDIESLIKGGWLEEIKEPETLAKKFLHVHNCSYSELAKIASQHFAEKVKKSINKYAFKCCSDDDREYVVLTDVLKALEEG